MGEIFGMAGQIAAASIAAGAMKDATKMQIEALEKQKQFVFDQLEPGKVNAQATAADIDRAKSRLALQGKLDPALLQTRYAASDKLLEATKGLGQGTSEMVGEQAAREALGGGGVAEQMKQRLIDTALEELDAGATLPPDVQAELVKAGLERSGSVSGAATSRGMGGNIARQMIGERALALKSERQGKAIAMTEAANQLEQSRAGLLQSLFPALKQNQLANISGAQAALTTSASEMPQAGLSGESIANIWMARVGATNQLAQSAADAAGRQAMGLGQIWGNAASGIGTGLGRGFNQTDWAGLFKSGTGSSGSSGTTGLASMIGMFGGG